MLKSGLFCISFDAVSLSGVIVELLKIAKIFHANHYEIYLDLGYEIKFDKRKFFVPYSQEKKIFPTWINLIKIIKQPFYEYSEEFVEYIFQKVINTKPLTNTDNTIIQKYVDYIVEKLIKIWRDCNIQYILIENGTLPENIIFTKALYKAIEIYGNQNNFNKYVIWRDHDLMWSSEYNSNKYGEFPYVNTEQIIPSKFISHVVLHAEDLQAVQRWSPGAPVSVLRNNFPVQKINNSQDIKKQFREKYKIPENAILFARCSRIIPQKRIDRDIYLIRYLQQIARLKKSKIEIFLMVAGNIHENTLEYFNLKKLIAKFNLENYIFFIGELSPVCYETNCETNSKNFILASDVAIFMTSYDYDSFGNPIAEAIALNKPYIATNYHRYQHVYGQLGYQGLLFNITPDDEQITRDFAKEVYNFILDKQKLIDITKHNHFLMQQHARKKIPLINHLNNLLNIQLQ